MTIKINGLDGELEVLSDIALDVAIKAKREALENDKKLKLQAIYADPATDPMDKVKLCNAVVAETADDIKPVLIAYFEGDFYNVPVKPAVQKSEGKQSKSEKIYHQDGEIVQYVLGENKSDLFLVVRNENGKQVLESEDGKRYNPSVIVCNMNNKPIGSMPGLSDRNWVKIR